MLMHNVNMHIPVHVCIRDQQCMWLGVGYACVLLYSRVRGRGGTILYESLILMSTGFSQYVYGWLACVRPAEDNVVTLSISALRGRLLKVCTRCWRRISFDGRNTQHLHRGSSIKCTTSLCALPVINLAPYDNDWCACCPIHSCLPNMHADLDSFKVLSCRAVGAPLCTSVAQQGISGHCRIFGTSTKRQPFPSWRSQL